MRPFLWTRTWPLPSRSATAATVSLVFLVQELTARIRSPRESFWGDFKICVFFFIELSPVREQIRCHRSKDFARPQAPGELRKRPGARGNGTTFNRTHKALICRKETLVVQGRIRDTRVVSASCASGRRRRTPCAESHHQKVKRGEEEHQKDDPVGLAFDEADHSFGVRD